MPETQYETGLSTPAAPAEPIDPKVRSFLTGVADQMNGGGSGGGSNVVPFPQPDRVENWETKHNNFGGLRIPGVQAGPNAGGFQSFGSAEQGIAAIANQLDRYVTGATTGKPLQTLREIVSTWAPSSENDTHLLIHRAAAVMGVDPDQPLNVGDPKTRAKLIESTIRNEQGGKLPVDPAVIQKVANDPGYQPSSDAMVDRFDKAAGMMNAAMGPFAGSAKALVDQALARINTEVPGHAAAMAEAKDVRSFERAAMARWLAESNAPPKNQHENWQQWGAIAQMFALVGPLFGRRSATTALNAAGDMLQAANQADQHRYDQAYAQWKGHNDSMLKAVELFHAQYKEIIDDDRRSYDQKQAEITTLLSAAGIVSRLDPEGFEKQERALRVAKDRADLTKAQNEETETRLAVKELDDQWVAEHPGQTVPASVHNQNVGTVKQARAGKVTTAGALTDDAAQFMAQQYLAGDRSVMGGLGYGNTGAANRAKLRDAIQAEARARGMSPAEVATTIAEFEGLKAGERTLGTTGARIGLGLAEAKVFAPMVLEASDKVSRTQYPTLNALLLAYDRGTGDENVVRLGIAINALQNAYSQVLTRGGVPTDAARATAHEIFDKAYSAGQMRTAVDQVMREIDAAQAALGIVKQEMRDRATGRPSSPPAGAAAAPPAAVDYLRQHPEARDQFDSKYGSGAAARALGQ